MLKSILKQKGLFDGCLMHNLTKVGLISNTNSFLFKILGCLFRISFGKGTLHILKLDLTNRCNQNCKYCYVKKGSEDLDIKYVFKIIDGLNTGEIQLMGGEPLLRKDIFNIIKYAKRNKHLKCSIYTNGTLISKKIASNLKKAKLDYAIVTLMSDKSDMHDFLTGKKGSWKKTVMGIKNLIGEGIKTYTYTALTTSNIKKVKSIVKISQELGASPIFHRYMPQKKKDPLAIKDKDVWYKTKKWILYKQSPKHGTYIQRALILTKRSCNGGYTMLSVKPNGDVTPCPFIKDLILGNIKKKGISQIFKERFKNKEFVKFFEPSTECLTCSLVKICNSGCKAASKHPYKGFIKKDYLCKGPWNKKYLNNQICDYIPYWW